jgi:hypothetical protein
MEQEPLWKQLRRQTPALLRDLFAGRTPRKNLPMSSSRRYSGSGGTRAEAKSYTCGLICCFVLRHTEGRVVGEQARRDR